jgi:hypothetical protein
MLVWKIGAAAVALGLILAAMHFLLPSLATLRKQSLLGEGYELVETERLRLWVPRGTRLARKLAQDMEAFAAALYAEYGQALSLRPLEDRITIHLFASGDDLVKFARRRGMRQDMSHASGFYDPVTWSIALTLRPQDDLLALVFHETTHLLMDRPDKLRGAGWSLWLAEGMAVFFEHSAVTDDGIRMGGVDPRAAAHIVAQARRGRHVPLRELLDGGPELFHSDRGALCYSEAGTLVACLLQGARRDGFLRYYRHELDRGPRSREILEQCLGLSVEELEREWLAFLQGNLR